MLMHQAKGPLSEGFHTMKYDLIPRHSKRQCASPITWLAINFLCVLLGNDRVICIILHAGRQAQRLRVHTSEKPAFRRAYCCCFTRVCEASDCLSAAAALLTAACTIPVKGQRAMYCENIGRSFQGLPK